MKAKPRPRANVVGGDAPPGGGGRLPAWTPNFIPDPPSWLHWNSPGSSPGSNSGPRLPGHGHPYEGDPYERNKRLRANDPPLWHPTPWAHSQATGPLRMTDINAQRGNRLIAMARRGRLQQTTDAAGNTYWGSARRPQWLQALQAPGGTDPGAAPGVAMLPGPNGVMVPESGHDPYADQRAAHVPWEAYNRQQTAWQALQAINARHLPRAARPASVDPSLIGSLL